MNAPEWSALRSWLVDLGAITDDIKDAKQIRRLDLSGLGLTQLHDAIGLLCNLIALNLSNNLLNALPDSFGALQSLVNLDMRRNKFQALPKILGSLQLRSLNASGNELTDIKILEQCPELRVLDLSANALAEVGACLHVQNELRSLNLTMNYLRDVDAFFSGLGNVEQLFLSENLLKTVPQSIGMLEALEKLDLSGNRIESFSDAFFDLAIESVDLSSNDFKTLHLHGLEDLEEITLDDNPIESLTVADDFAPHLLSFSCDGCELEEFLMLPSTSLESLCYSSNDICDVPSEISRYTNLRELDIDYNLIETLPLSFRELTALHSLYADGNPLDEASKAMIASMQIDVCDLETKSEITVRTATKDDIAAMSELIGVLFAIESDFRPNPKKQVEGLAQLMACESADLFVAEHQNRVIGMITMQRLISSAEGGPIGQLEDIVVDDAYRRMGVGSKLIEAMTARGFELGYRRIQLAADRDNAAALDFYVRKGFRRTHLAMFHLVAPE